MRVEEEKTERRVNRYKGYHETTILWLPLLPWLPWLDAGDGVPLGIALGGERVWCTTISRFAGMRCAFGELERLSRMRSEPVGDLPGGLRAAVASGGSGMPGPLVWPARPAPIEPIGRGCGGSIVGSGGLGGE